MRRWLPRLTLAGLLAVATGAGALTTVPILSMADYPAGTRPFAATAILVGTEHVTLTVDISQAADPLPGFVLVAELSFDGGTTWGPGPGCGRAAGPKGTNRLGQPATSLGCTGTIPEASNPARRARGSVTVDGPVRIAATVTLLP
jgi:hypothetical protein